MFKSDLMGDDYAKSIPNKLLIDSILTLSSQRKKVKMGLQER
jgi:hypothetical protein